MAMRGLAVAASFAALCGPAAAVAQSAPGAPAGQPPRVAQSLPDVDPAAAAFAGTGGRVVSVGDPDADATLAAIADFNQRGMAGLGEHEAALRTVLADMPRPFVRERVDGGRVVYRGDSMADCIAFFATLKGGPNGGRKLVCEGNPYAVAGFYLGSYLNAAGRYDLALAALEQGLEAAPASPMLITERNVALFGLKRWDAALAGAKRGLDVANLAPSDRARLLRNLGFALTELQRLDEAQQAYEASLQLEPGNALAQNELRYIAGLKASGGRAGPGQLLTPNTRP